MKKFLNLSLVIVFLGILFTSNLNAACPLPMPGDDPATPFIGPIVVTFTTPGGCTIQYEYCYRTTTSGQREFWLDVIAIWGPGGAGTTIEDVCSEYLINSYPYGVRIAELVDACAEHLIYYINPWFDGLNIPPCCPPSSDPCWTDPIYRMGIAKCWGEMLYNPITDRLFITHCESPGVCWSVIKMCSTLEPDGQGGMRNKLHFDKTPIYHDGTQCVPIGGGSCQTSCGE